MSKKILVAVTGSTPQILTETVYALYKEKSWVPDEIHVLTTTHGEQQIIEKLFENGIFKALCDEYGLRHIQFSPESIHVIENEQSEKISDIKTVEENDLAANMIVKFIHDLCQEPDNELHVSLAGGRKSMGFYVGYALSLFGRAQDSMSHVLVSHPYEFAREFFFPTKREQEIEAVWWEDGIKKSKRLDSKEAEIWLSDIPFVRMGLGYVPIDFSSIDGYRNAVELTQTKISDYSVVVDLPNKKLIFNEDLEEILPPQQIVFYAIVAKATKAKKRITAHSQIKSAYSISQMSDDYLSFYKSAKKHTDETKESLMRIIEDTPEIIDKFSPASSNIDKKLKKTLGERSTHFEIKSAGENYGKYYYLAIDPDNITIIE